MPIIGPFLIRMAACDATSETKLTDKLRSLHQAVYSLKT